MKEKDRRLGPPGVESRRSPQSEGEREAKSSFRRQADRLQGVDLRGGLPSGQQLKNQSIRSQVAGFGA